MADHILKCQGSENIFNIFSRIIRGNVDWRLNVKNKMKYLRRLLLSCTRGTRCNYIWILLFPVKILLNCHSWECDNTETVTNQTQATDTNLDFLQVFATNSNFVIPISLQPDSVSLGYFILNITAFIVWNIKGLNHRVAKIQGLWSLNLWQKLNSCRKMFKKI